MINQYIVTTGEVSEDLFNAKYSYLLEGFTYTEVTELWFAARN